jgi:signal peptide peptidase SppA
MKIIRNFLNKLSKKKKIVAVINLHGVIGNMGKFRSGLNLNSLNDRLEAAFKIKNAKAVVLSINSPGGSPVQSELIFNRIRQLAEEYKKPVLSFAEDIAASGGYWLLCAGDELYASNNSIIGSIGVISSGFGFEKAINKLGIERRVYTQGKNKSLLDPFLPEKKTDIEILKDAQKDLHQEFKNLVLSCRRNKLNESEDKLFNGEFWSGKKAKEFGLIDEIGGLHQIVRKKYGKDTTILIMNEEKSWLKKKLGMQLDSRGFMEHIQDYLEINSLLSKFGL